MILAKRQTCRLLMAVALAVVPLAAQAGEIALEWDPVNSPDLAGYRIYYGTDVTENQLRIVDVPVTTSAVLAGLMDCSMFYVAVKARDRNGLVSVELSDIIQGYPRPAVHSVSPGRVSVGDRTTVQIHGAGFVPGAVPEFEKGILVKSVRVDHCYRMTAEIQVLKSAQTGRGSVTVVNEDRAYGTLAQALEITPEGEGEGEEEELAVRSVSPEGSGVPSDPTTPIKVTFSRAIDPSSVGTKTFKVTGSAKVALGAPDIDPTGRVVTLNSTRPLPAGGSYSVTVKGGKKGVTAADGTPLSATFQGPAFSTYGLFSEMLYGDSGDAPGRKIPPSGQAPQDSVILLRFAELIDPVSVTAKTVKIKGKGKITLEGGGPVLQEDGLTVALQPTQPLPAGTNFQIIIKGGKKGIQSERGVTMADKKLVLPFSTPIGSVESLGLAE